MLLLDTPMMFGFRAAVGDCSLCDAWPCDDAKAHAWPCDDAKAHSWPCDDAKAIAWPCDDAKASGFFSLFQDLLTFDEV